MIHARHGVAAWDRAAGAYARQEHLEHRAIRRALDLLSPAPGEVLLDAATGTGIVLRELARRPAPPRRATGLDSSPRMLGRVGVLPDGWCTRLGDITALDAPAASFHVAVAAYVLQVLAPAERAAALAELRRVLRPGGRLVVVTPWTPRVPVRAALDLLARTAPATLQGLATHDPRDGLRHAGWTVVRTARVHHGYPSLVVLARP